MLVLAGILLTGSVLWLVLGPLVTGSTAPLSDGPDRQQELRELQTLRDVAYETLRDIELDYHAGKISEADYGELNDRYKAEALSLLRRIDAVSTAPPDAAERSPDVL